MIRLFNTYFPTRTLLLTLSEAVLVTSGFLLAVLFSSGTAEDARIYLLYEDGANRIGLVVLVFLLLMYYFDLYNTSILTNRREVLTRLVGVLGCTFVALAARSKPKSAGEALHAALRAEAVKVVLMFVLLWAVLATYKNVVAIGLIGTFIAAVLIFTMAVWVREK